jgi:hypothetical protein
MLRDLASALQQTQAERDAMQRRAEAAESDWQYAESALTATQKLTVHSLAKAEAAHQRLREAHASRPTIICLCGSTRFIETFAVQTWELELQGFIVLGCTLLPSWYCPVRDHFAENQGVKPQRDAHHLQKIDLADEVLVLNVGGYIGESTRNEIAYAIAHDKPVRYLEPLPASPATVASGTCSRSATR